MNVNDIQSIVLSLTAKVNNLELEVASLKQSIASQKESVVTVKSKKSSSPKVQKPEGLPKDPTPVHHRFTKLLKTKKTNDPNEISEYDQIKDTIRKTRNITNEQELEKATKKEVSILFAKEKGHKLFDQNGKPTDKTDKKNYTERLQKIFSDYASEKEKSKVEKIEFEKTEAGQKYKEEKSQKSSENAKTKKETKKESGPKINPPGEFEDLTNML